MSETVVRVEGLGKQYRIGARREPYKSLRDSLADAAMKPVRAVRSLLSRNGQRRPSPGGEIIFWALKDVSFEVRRGEVVGVIGRNGAGKTTLLKILSRITEPTKGSAEIHGRVGSLLEVGTGFHPELSGRDNIILNGAILGMRRTEIDRKFDEIVAFAEVEKFIDTPVKHYSSGMYMRLAFAVAAHLDPEILIVDEVLAVGDLEFQRKCLAKMKDVSEAGRTVIFVSHNMAAVQSLCKQAVVLKDGYVLGTYASPSDAIAVYSGSLNPVKQVWQRPDKPGDQAVLAFRALTASLLGDQPTYRLRIVAELESRHPHSPALIAFDILDAASTPIMQALPSLQPIISYEPVPQHLEITIELPPLIPGAYRVTAWLGPNNMSTYDLVNSALSFEILTSPTPMRSFPHTADHGCIIPHSTVDSLVRMEATPAEHVTQ